MKRHLPTLVLVILFSLLCGCGSSEPESPAPASAPVTAPTAAPTTMLPPAATATPQPEATRLPATEPAAPAATVETPVPAVAGTAAGPQAVPSLVLEKSPVDYFGKRWGQGYVVQLNDGGRFSTGWQMEDEGSTLGGVALADFDGDSDLDALVLNGFRSTGWLPGLLFWNDGRGQFVDSGQRLNQTLGAELAVGDLDGDGDLDVFVANMDLPNEVWLNEGGRLIDSGLRLGGIPPEAYSTKPSLGDLDSDGDLDVFVGSLMGRPEIWFNVTVASRQE